MGQVHSPRKGLFLPNATAGCVISKNVAGGLGVVILLIMIVSAGVRTLIIAGTRMENYDRLLKKGEFTRENVEKEKKASGFSGFYWPIIVAIFLAISFITDNWEMSWIVWPVAALVYVAIKSILRNRD